MVPPGLKNLALEGGGESFSCEDFGPRPLLSVSCDLRLMSEDKTPLRGFFPPRNALSPAVFVLVISSGSEGYNEKRPL